MNNFTLYFVGFYKHSAIQSLLAGPFVTFDAAEKALLEMDEDMAVVCETTLPFKISVS